LLDVFEGPSDRLIPAGSSDAFRSVFAGQVDDPNSPVIILARSSRGEVPG
jgi:hypothetical protein